MQRDNKISTGWQEISTLCTKTKGLYLQGSNESLKSPWNQFIKEMRSVKNSDRFLQIGISLEIVKACNGCVAQQQSYFEKLVNDMMIRLKLTLKCFKKF